MDRRVAWFLLISALLHLLGFWLADLLLPPDLKEVFRPTTHLPYRRFPIERFKPRPPIAVPKQLLERLRAEAGRSTGVATMCRDLQ